ncbi:ATP-binding protein [Hymenobacter sp. 15J16-1T3B]|uniref:ATP-binding protein n=1 Tax=Hymenobacter sp. 15J16-1T3B TaxID=2886941 RepID=UPI001D103AA9|nr:ATP-binding protein [Hymenobacter sp. 15J16-1T3B]MCC3156456.1 ATP-binding protein [Hymenobacter sp. 15J16-1T3B]
MRLDKAGWDIPAPQDFRENDRMELPLTDQEANWLLQQGRQAKYHAAWGQWYRWRLAESAKPQEFTADEIWQWFHLTAQRILGKPYEVTDYNRWILNQLCLYFAGDKRFEKDGRSLEKGIMLRGGVGCGKTTLLTLFAGNPRQPFEVTPCEDVVGTYMQPREKGGREALRRFKQLNRIPSAHEPMYNYRQWMGHCFDDLGTEDWNARHMGGDPFNCMAGVLSGIDDAVVAGRMPRHAVHLTTNLLFDDYQVDGENIPGIESIYGTRVRSRIRGLMNVLTFPNDAPDLRA